MSNALTEAVAALTAGKIIVLTGDRLRGGDIDLAMAASKAGCARSTDTISAGVRK